MEIHPQNYLNYLTYLMLSDLMALNFHFNYYLIKNDENALKVENPIKHWYTPPDYQTADSTKPTTKHEPSTALHAALTTASVFQVLITCLIPIFLTPFISSFLNISVVKVIIIASFSA